MRRVLSAIVKAKLKVPGKETVIWAGVSTSPGEREISSLLMGMRTLPRDQLASCQATRARLRGWDHLAGNAYDLELYSEITASGLLQAPHDQEKGWLVCVAEHVRFCQGASCIL